MAETIVTPLIPSEHEYAIVATFSEQTLDSLMAIQAALTDLLGDAIWLTPPQALHSTLIEIICDTDYYGSSRQKLFEEWHEQYNQQTAATIADLSPCSITFTELEVSPRAVIVKTARSGSFNDFRAKLLSNIALPQGTKTPPDITHCSLARFNESLDFDILIELTGAIKVGIPEHISRFMLLKDLGPPSFTPKVIETYDMNVS
jgi:hypothetical protein